ncbi:hypothetical protein CCACVL1_17858 [Corchorus capsularis]|uniref:Uncharacterized protein n=1 Tax=Corchorus capsularis TaxID=210143 RepID=A0A1R3HPH6_COCAP|nr:hypothetical protein CCACVL1_17858 [Corchorus capsularis]
MPYDFGTNRFCASIQSYEDEDQRSHSRRPTREAYVREGCWSVIALFATAPHHCIIAISLSAQNLSLTIDD